MRCVSQTSGRLRTHSHSMKEVPVGNQRVPHSDPGIGSVFLLLSRKGLSAAIVGECLCLFLPAAFRYRVAE